MEQYPKVSIMDEKKHYKWRDVKEINEEINKLWDRVEEIDREIEALK
jgi:hypothetical protein